MAGLPAEATLYQSAGVDRRTADAYDRLLERLYLLDRLPAWSSNRLTRLAKRPKRYLADPALAVSAARVDAAAILRDGDLLGRVLDTFVTAQLRPEIALLQPRARLHHLRAESGRHEVDLILDLGGGRTIGVEVKAASAPGPRDARHLALVCTGRAAPALLDSYQAERRPVAQDVLASTSGMTRVMLGASATARLVRDHVLVPLMNRPLVQRLIWKRSSQLLISYRGGPLAARTRSRSRPRPGDRVPGLECRGADGVPTRLHAELGSGWAVFAADPAVREACADAAAEWLGTDAVARLAPESGAPGDALLVRPDAHLAWRGTDPAAVRCWLADALHRDIPAGTVATAG